MCPSTAKDPGAGDAPPGPPPASPWAALPVGLAHRAPLPSRPDGRSEGEPPAARSAERDGLRAIDADVPAAVERLLDRLLAERCEPAVALDPVFAHDLAARVARFTLAGGKRIRAQFVWWALRACGGRAGEADAALRVGAALELIQSCALVQDDVMDASRLRRGRPALHADVEAQYAEAAPAPRLARFGEAAAILAGDLALAWADDVVADTELAPDTARRVRGLWSAMRTEMVAGQYLDVLGQTTSSHAPARALRAARLKSALYSVERPLALGAALAGADDTTTAALRSAGRRVGIAFQLRDDLDDVFGSARRTGKPSGGDIRSGKPTYLVAVALARAEGSGDLGALAALRHSLGCADLSEEGLDRVRNILVDTGARAAVEAKADRLLAQGLRRLEAAVLEPDGRGRLCDLLRLAVAAPPARGPSSDPPGTAAGTAAPPLLTSAAEGVRS